MRYGLGTSTGPVPRCHRSGLTADRSRKKPDLGRLADDVVAAATQPFIDINDNAELAKFGLHNGPPQDRNNLGEKWEAMGLAPALDPTHPRDVVLLVANDNDFITQHGFHAGQAYTDASGADLDTMILVYRITLPSPPK